MIFRLKDGNLQYNKNINVFIWFQLYYVLFFGFFRDILGVPSFLGYIVDIINVFLIFYIIANKYLFRVQRGIYKIFFVIILLMFLSSILGLVINNVSILLYFWGFRNVFRFYLFFLSCCLLLNISDVIEVGKKLKIIYIINFGICIIEFLLGNKGDYLGGIFGTSEGCNGYLNIFLVVVSTIYIIEYLDKKINFINILFFLGSLFFIMAIAELKIILFELPIIVVMALLGTKFTIRKFTIVLLSIIAIIVGVSLLGYFFKEFDLSFFISNKIYEYSGNKGYTGSGDLNRFNAVPQLYNRFLKGNISNELFGIGLGNASYSSTFSVLNSEFYILYNLLHYQWFADAFIYIEMGAVGLFLFELLFILILISVRINFNKIKRMRKDVDRRVKIMLKVSGIVSIIFVFLSVYDSSLIVDAAYLGYFILSIPVIVNTKLNHL